jgi:hypothetical protein
MKEVRRNGLMARIGEIILYCTTAQKYVAAMLNWALSTKLTMQKISHHWRYQS